MKNISSMLDKKIKVKEQIFLINKLLVLLNANIPLVDSLILISNNHKEKNIKILLENIVSSIQSGERFSASIKKNTKIDTFLIGILEMGENTGDIINSLQVIKEHISNKDKITKRILTSLTYPLILVMCIVLLLFTITKFILPIFKNIYLGYGLDIPLSFKIFIFLEKTLLYLVILMILLILITYRLIKGNNYSIKYKIFKLFYSRQIIKKFKLYYLFSNLYYLMISKNTISQSLSKVIDIENNLYFKDNLIRLSQYIDKGNRFSASIKKSLNLDDELLSLIIVGEETGTLDNVFLTLSNLIKEECKYNINKKIMLIEPSLIIAMGVIIGAIVIFMVVPITNIDLFLN